MKSKLLQLLNIRKEEAWLVTTLFWLQFFQGAGVAVFNTVAFALFLQQFEVKELPKVYIFSAVLLWVTGFVYSKFEHKVSLKKLATGVIVFMAVSILLFRLEFFITHESWLLFFIFSWYYVIYLLSNLEFWGIASLMFDIRQSKRLFGMIGAGDIPAKLIGYSAVPILVKFFSAENLLLFSFVCIVLSLIFLQRLNKAGKLDIAVKHSHAPVHATASVTEIVKGFFGNRLIAQVAFLSFIVVTVVTVVSFSFYSEIKERTSTDTQLASFIAMFYAGGRIFAIFIRLILTGRITNMLGTRGSLLIIPLILFVVLMFVILMPLFTANAGWILYAFGIMAIMTEVLKTALQDPVFLSLMQPLPSDLRLKGHTIVKGVMDPFALGFSGFMLYSLMKVSGGVDLMLLSYFVLSLLIVWVAMIFVVDSEYVKTLVTALHKRYSVGQEMDLNSEVAVNVLRDKIEHGERSEVMYTLQLLASSWNDDKKELLHKALLHHDVEVKKQAIKIAEQVRYTEACDTLRELLNHNNVELIAPAVKALCVLKPDEVDLFEEYLTHQHEELRVAAITGLMKSGGISAVVVAGQKLLEWVKSPEVSERMLAARVIGLLGVSSFYKPLLQLINDPDKQVVLEAVKACGQVHNERLVQPLIKFFLKSMHQREILNALYKAGPVAIPHIQHTIYQENLSRNQLSKLIHVLGRIGTVEAVHILDTLIWEKPHVRPELFHALHMCSFEPPIKDQPRHIRLMHEYLQVAAKLVHMQQAVRSISTAALLADAMELELKEIREALLLLFSFVYDTEKINRARIGFQIGKKESIANALELIEVSVPKDIASTFIKIYESSEAQERVLQVKPANAIDWTYETILDEIMNDSKWHYHRWTKAAALHSLIFYKGFKKSQWLHSALESSDLLLNQTARKIKQETPAI